MSFALVMPSSYLIFCCPLLLLPSVFPSNRLLSNESAVHIKWPKYWNFSFSISPSSEYSGLISLKIDWFDLLVVQGTLRSYTLYVHSIYSYMYTNTNWHMYKPSHCGLASNILVFQEQKRGNIKSAQWWGPGLPHNGVLCSCIKNEGLQTVNTVREGKGGVYGESSIGTHTLPYIKWIASGSLLHDAASANPGLCDNLEA